MARRKRRVVKKRKVVKRRRKATVTRNKVTSKGRGITVKMKNGRVVAYRRFNTKTRRFSWKKVSASTPQSRARVLAKLHAFAGRKS